MSGLFQELKRRNVFRVAIAYVAVAWLILQVADIVFDNIMAPTWLMQALMFFLAIGFPPEAKVGGRGVGYRGVDVRFCRASALPAV